MIKITITGKIKNFVNFQKLGYVATISADNTPNLSPKGTIIVLDESYLAFADIHSPQTVENLKRNPAIEINVVDPFSRRGYRFKGIAEIISTGDKFDKMLSGKYMVTAINHIIGVKDDKPVYDMKVELTKDGLNVPVKYRPSRKEE